MNILQQHDAEVRALRRRAWWFIAGGLLLAAAMLGGLAARQGFFVKTVPLYFVAHSAADMNKGMPVKVFGFRIGRVGEIRLQPDATVKVRMDVEESYRRFITRDAVALVHKEGFVGGGTIDIVPGKDKDIPAEPEAMLKYEPSVTLTEIANQLHDEIVPILRDVKTITGTLADPDHGIARTVHSVNETVANLQAVTANLKSIAQHGDQQLQTLGGKTAATLDQAEADLAEAGRTMKTINTKLGPMLQKVDGLVSEVAEQAPAAIRDGRAAVTDTREILDGAKKSWPVRNLVAPPKTGPLPADSYAPYMPSVPMVSPAPAAAPSTSMGGQ
ncbi:MAG TPA: MlaD family protein [Rhodocyclaceae bacterium]|nr:MlaD family protein [Rhodocyclaceae bacterium]